MKKRSKKKISISELPKYTSLGILVGIVAVISFLVLIVISTKDRGLAGIGIGFAGVLVMIASGFGLYMAIKGAKEDENMYYTMPVVSLGLNGIVLIMTFVLYIMGLFI